MASFPVQFSSLACAINNGFNAASFASASITPPTSGLVIGFIYTRGVNVPAVAPTISGWGLTWSTISSVVHGNSRIDLVAANLSGATTGALTISYGATVQDSCTASFTRAVNVDLGGGVASAFVQVVTDNTGTSTSGSVTLASAANAVYNRPILAVSHEANEATTPRANWTEGDDLADVGNPRNLEVQWRSDAFETTASATWTTSALYTIIAVEIKAFIASYTLTIAPGAFTMTPQALTLTYGLSVTITATQLAVSNLEITATLVDNTLNGSASYANYRATAIPNMQGMYTRLASFIGGFGETGLLFNWDGTGAVPTVSEVRGGKNVFDVSGCDRFYAVATALGVPMDWIVWRLPWQFTESPEGVASTANDYYSGQGERRRLRQDATTVANYTLFLRRLGKYLMENCAARRFKNGSEAKGYQQDTFHSPPLSQTFDYNYYYDFYAATQNALYLAADDAVGVTRADIVLVAPYNTSRIQGGTGTSANLITFDTRLTVTAPVQTIRYKDDAVPPAWNMNEPSWGNPFKPGWQLFMEFFKLCSAAVPPTPVNSAAWDYHLLNADGIIKDPNDFSNAENRVRDISRFVKRALNDLSGGQYVALKDWMDMTEIYWMAQSTIVDTNNTLVTPNPDGSTKPPPALPEGYLTPAKAYEYMGAVKAIALAVCAEEGVRTPCFWSPNGRADARTAPALVGVATGGGYADEQTRYGAAIIGQGEPNEGAITAVGTIVKNINQKFGLGTRLRVVTVSDKSKIYALASDTDLMLVNKTGVSQTVSVNPGSPQTLTPYQTTFTTFAVSYILPAGTGSYSLSGRVAVLEYGHRIAAAQAVFAESGRAASLVRLARLQVAVGTLVFSGPAASLKAARTLALARGLDTLTGNSTLFIHQPPSALLATTGVLALSAPTTRLIATRSLTVARSTLTYTGFAAALGFGHGLAAAPASYALNGRQVAPLAQRLLVAGTAHDALSGQTIAFVWQHRLVVAPGALTFSGLVIALLRGRRVTQVSGVYALARENVGLLVGYALVVTRGLSAWAGQAVSLIYASPSRYVLEISTAPLTIQGKAVGLVSARTLLTSGAPYGLTGANTVLIVAAILRAVGGSIPLSGQDLAIQWAHAPVVPLPVERIMIVDSDRRVTAIEFENRIFVVS